MPFGIPLLIGPGAISAVVIFAGVVAIFAIGVVIHVALAVQFIIVGVSDTTAGIIRRSVAHPYPTPPAAATSVG